jgi:drug/metabolite transporter (DMT)-like permease
MAIVYAVLSAVVFGGADFIGGLATRRAPAVTVVVTSHLAGLAVVGAAAPLWGGAGADASDLLWGAAAGAAGSSGLVIFYHALATTRFTIVAPSAALLGAVVPVAFGLAIGERPEALAWLGVALALPAILLISRMRVDASTPPGIARRALLLGSIAGALFGLFGILISRTADTSGLWPLLGARVASVPTIAVLALVRRRPLIAEGRVLGIAVVAGATDMLANMFLLAGLHEPGLVSMVILISSLYPGFTVLLARLVLEERIGRAQAAGLVMAAAGIALISVA